MTEDIRLPYGIFVSYHRLINQPIVTEKTAINLYENGMTSLILFEGIGPNRMDCSESASNA